MNLHGLSTVSIYFVLYYKIITRYNIIRRIGMCICIPMQHSIYGIIFHLHQWAQVRSYNNFHLCPPKWKQEIKSLQSSKNKFKNSIILYNNYDTVVNFNNYSIQSNPFILSV